MVKPMALMLALCLLALPVLAEEEHSCEHDVMNIESLQHCVHHALEMEHIDSAGVAQSLLAKLSAAQASLGRGRSSTAVSQLEAFVNEVQAQSGKHIVAEHADHLVMHARMVIDALRS